MVKQVNLVGTYRLEPLGNNVFFTATDPVNGMQLWKSNGTAAGTTLVKVIASAKGGSGSFSLGLGVLKSTLFFTANDGVHGLELWQTDGTAAGTRLTKDICPDNPPSITPASQPTGGVIKLTRRPVNNGPFRVFSTDGLYFIADDCVHGRELWWISYDSVK
jgi:ELWxxDGT repeat protein